MRSSVSASALALAAGLAMATVGSNALAQPAAAGSNPRDAEIATLKAMVERRESRVETLEARQAAPVAPPVATAPSPPPFAAIAASGNGGATILGGKPTIQSGDGRFSATLHGVMQFDAAQYLQPAAGPTGSDFRRGATNSATDTGHARDLNSGTDFRRARIGVDGKVFGDFEYNVLFDFGGAGEEDGGHVQELWVQYSGLKPFHARIGAFPPSIGLEDQASTNGAPFLERPAIADMARSLAGGDFREAAEIWGGTDRWYVNAAVTGRLVGVSNVQGTTVLQPYDSQLGLIGRVAVIPYKDENWLFHLGVHGSYAVRPADAAGPDVASGTARYPITFQERPELRVDGTRLVSTGGIDAVHASTVGLEAALQYRNVFVEGEYEQLAIQRRNAAAGVSNPSFHGFYAEGTWVMTGEIRRYNINTFAFDAPSVDHPFSLQNGTWGAFELALRYSDADLNYLEGLPGTAVSASGVRGGDQRIFAAGLNWYPNSVVRFMFQFQDVTIDRLSAATSFTTPVGVQIGQHYNTIAVRSQMAF